MRELLEIAKDDAPAAALGIDDIVAAGRRRKRWTIAARIGGAGVVAAAALGSAALLVISQSTVTSNTTRTGSPPKAAVPVQAQPAPPFTYTFSGYPVGAYEVVEPHEVTPADQVASILGPSVDTDGKPATWVLATMTVYQPGVFSTTSVSAGTKLTVLGREAYQTSVERNFIQSWPQVNGKTSTTVSVLAWQYADNAWATIEDEPLVRDAIPLASKVTVAELLRTEQQVTARLPFRTGYLPAGWALQGVSGRSFEAKDTGMVWAVYAAPSNAFRSMSGPRNFDAAASDPSVVIAIGQQDTPPPDAPKKKDTCIAGQHWCTWPIAGTRFYLAVNDPSKTLSDAELLRIGQSLTFVTIDQPDTWIPVV
jgi:hypothetical protein